MPFKDMILMHFDANERANVLNLLNQIRDILQPKLVQISAEDRQRYGSVSEENKKIINKVRDLIEEDPVNVPAEVDWAEFAADYSDRRFLESIRSMMTALLFEVEGTKILHDYDNYQDALTYYRNQVYRMESGAANAEGKVEQLKQFFNRTAPKKEDEGNNNTTPPTV